MFCVTELSRPQRGPWCYRHGGAGAEGQKGRETQGVFSLFCGEEWFHQLTPLNGTSSSFSEKGKGFFARSITVKTDRGTPRGTVASE